MTNSSSTSFIVACKKEVNKEYVMKVLKDEVERMVKDEHFDYCYDFDKEKSLAEKTHHICDLVSNYIVVGSDMELGDWNLKGGEISSECCDVIDAFLYFGNIDDEKIKLTCCH